MLPGGRTPYRREGFENRPRINEQIRIPYVRVIGPDRKPIGILPIRDAIQLARRQDLDLVELAPSADPPVCGILDYGRYAYQQKVKDRESKKKTHSVSVREMRFMMRISVNDYDTKMKKVREFLIDRDRVRVTIRLRGREVLHKDLAFKLAGRIRTDLADLAAVEGEPRIAGEGRQSIQLMFFPKVKEQIPGHQQTEATRREEGRVEPPMDADISNIKSSIANIKIDESSKEGTIDEQK
jgi:translation initiation factor IF-3